MIGYGNSLGVYILNPYIYGAGAAFANDYSLLFDGVDEDLVTSNISTLQGATNLSVSFWFKVNTDGNFNILRRYVSGSNAFMISYDSVGNRMIFRNYQIIGSEAYSSTFNPTLGQWYHFVVSYNGAGSTNSDKVQMYIDGVAEILTFNVAHPATTNNNSGNYEIVFSRVGAMNVDEVSIFDYSLTSGQVTSIYNSGTPTDLDNTSGVTAPVHWWRMGDGDTYPTITDVGTTGGNDGTMTNMEAGDIVTDTP